MELPFELTPPNNLGEALAASPVRDAARVAATRPSVA
jgi:hypothetical protein